MKIYNKSLLVMAFILVFLFTIPFVSAAPVFDVEVKNVPQIDEPVSIFAGENVPIKIKVKVTEDIDEVYARAEFEHSEGKTTALSSEFDLEDNVTYVLDEEDGLYLGIPQDVDIDDDDSDNLSIRIQLEDEDGDVIESEGVELRKEFRIILDRESNKIKIQNVTMPDVFKANERILVTATIKNLGKNVQSELYGQLRISSLGILSKVDIGSIDEAGDDDDEETEDIPLTIPKFTPSGTYTLELKIFNDEVSTSYIRTIDIDGERAALKFTEVLPRDVLLNVEQNGRAVFKISIVNLGTTTQTYDILLNDDVKDWGTVQIEPSRVTLDENEKKVVEVYVSPNSNTLGEQVFTATVRSDNDIVEELQLVADVKESELNLSTIDPFLLTLISTALVLLSLIFILFGARMKAGFKSRIKSVMQTYEARDIGREEAKEEMSNLMHDMVHNVFIAKDDERESLIDKSAGRAVEIIHPLKSSEVEEVITRAVNKLSEKEGIEDEQRSKHRIEVRDHTQNLISRIIDKLKNRDDTDDILHDVSKKIEAKELGQEGREKAIATLESLGERLSEESEKLEEEEESAKFIKSRRNKRKKHKKMIKKKKAKKKSVKKKPVKKKKIKRKHAKKKSVRKVKSRVISSKIKKRRKPVKRTIKKNIVRKITANPVQKKKTDEKPSLVEKISTTRTIEKY